MSSKALRIACIANELYLSEVSREAGLIEDVWNFITRKAPKLQKELTSTAVSLARYLNKSHKVNFIKKKLGTYRNINSLKKALDFLLENLENMNEDRKIIQQVENLIQLIDETKEHLEKKEIDQLGKSIAQTLISNTTTASIITGTSEALESGDKDDVEDGVTSHPLEDGQEEEA